jgi:hypothetical protein
VGSGEGKRTGAFFFIAGRAHKAESEGNDESGRGCVARSPRSGFPSGMEEGTGRGTGWCVGGGSGRGRETRFSPHLAGPLIARLSRLFIIIRDEPRFSNERT